MNTGRQRLTFQGHNNPVADVRFSSDGKWLVSGGGGHDESTPGELKIWDAEDGREIKSLQGHAGAVLGLAVSPDCRQIASTGLDQTVRIWDSATGIQSRLLEGHSGIVWCVCFSPDGKLLASGGDDHIVRVWDVANGQQINSFDRHENRVTGIVFSLDGKHVTSTDERIWRWNTALP